MASHIFPENPRRLWRSIKKGGRFELEAPVDQPPTSDATSAPEVPILATRKDGRLGKFKKKLVVRYGVDTEAEGSDEIDGKELEVTTPIQRRRIHSTSPSPTQVSTTTNEVIRSSKPPQLPPRSSTRPSTLASNSTNFQPPMNSTSRDPMSTKLESVFYHHCCWNTTGNFTDQKKMNKKVVTYLFKEVDVLTEDFLIKL
ncbi:hypothetical protein O181_087899 [Austropuccinia psidii MF-1]|uniref:Uncharacterized protein n=1 Tax=Austropuccinia psidii MF-1 TaxID=1389203 RepID=A0A9Q3IQN0_9BASI|nr:hypothetical protein [Austropuccinia psidii MF-1]